METTGTPPAPSAEIIDRAAIGRRVTHLAWPAVLQSLISTGVFFVDSLMVGRLGAIPMAAIGVAGPISWGVHSLCFALSRGTLTLIARAMGAGDRARAGHVAWTSLRSILALGVLAGGGLALAAGPIYEAFGVEKAVADLGRPYLVILMLGTPVTLYGMFLRIIFQAAGDTRTPLIAGAFANLANIVGDYVLIFGAWGFPRLGVAGAAIATVVAHAAEALWLAAVLRRRGDWLPVPDPAARGASGPLLVQIARISAPAMGETLCFHSAYLLFSRIVALLGTEALAVHRIAIAAESIAFLPAEGFTVAASTLTGQYLGARRREDAHYGLINTVLKSLVWMVPLTFLFGFHPEFVCRWFTSDPSLIEPLAAVLRIAAIEMPFLGAACVLVGGLQGAGDTRSPFVVTTLGAWIFRVPGSYLLGVVLDLGVVGVWIATTGEWILRTILMILVVRRRAWLDLDPENDAGRPGRVEPVLPG